MLGVPGPKPALTYGFEDSQVAAFLRYLCFGEPCTRNSIYIAGGPRSELSVLEPEKDGDF